jgi:hypothetical protein
VCGHVEATLVMDVNQDIELGRMVIKAFQGYDELYLGLEGGMKP